MKLGKELAFAFIALLLVIGICGNFGIKFVQDVFTKNIIGNSEAVAEQTITEIDMNIFHRIEQVKAYSIDLSGEKELLASNNRYAKMLDRKTYIAKIDKEWKDSSDLKNPIIKKIENNELSRKMREEFELKDFYEKIYGYQVFSEVFVTNKYGANVAVSHKTTDFYQADEKWWQSAKKTGLYISDVIYDRSAGTYVLNICTRIDDKKGNFLGVLKTTLNLEEIISTVNQARRRSMYKSTGIELISPKRGLIYETDPGFDMFADVDKLVLFSNKSGNSNYMILKDAGIEKLIIRASSTGYRDFKGLGWVLLLDYNTGEILAPIFVLRKYLLLAIVVVLAFTLIVGVFLYRRVLIPITKIKETALQVSSGKLDANVDVPLDDEIGELATTINEMTAKLKRKLIAFEKKSDKKNGKAEKK